MNYDLSVIIAARNEELLPNTIDDILRNRRGKTECIVICDGGWPEVPIADHPDVTLIHLPESIGQRAAVNLGARHSASPWIMKSDAHVAFDEGFDTKLLANCQPDWIIVPRLFNLHAFDFRCVGCDARSYQGPQPDRCGECKGTKFEKVTVWLPRNGEYWRCSACKEFVHSKTKPTSCSECGARAKFATIENRVTDSMRFDSELQFGYFRDFHPQEGLAAFMHAKGESWVHRLLAADIENPSDKLIERAREYVVAYDSLPLPKKYELRAKAIKILALIRSTVNTTEAGKVKSAHLLNLVEMAQGEIVETMSLLGACWFANRNFYFDVLGGLDEGHGSWGAMGTELAAKAATSGSRLVCSRATWYSHLFRTASGFAFPYGMSGTAQEAAKQYSRNLWRNNAWSGQKYPLSFLLDKFYPIPGWSDADIAEQKAREANHPKFGQGAK